MCKRDLRGGRTQSLLVVPAEFKGGRSLLRGAAPAPGVRSRELGPGLREERQGQSPGVYGRVGVTQAGSQGMVGVDAGLRLCLTFPVVEGLSPAGTENNSGA